MSILHLDGNSKLVQPKGIRETFVPLHAKDVVDYLAMHPALQESQQADFQELATLVLSLLHHRYRQKHERATYSYAPLDPDRDRLLRSVPIASQRNRMVEWFIDDTRDALERANYHKLSPYDIQQALEAASNWGVRMRVRFSTLSRLEVYGRGLAVGKREFRNWRKFFRRETIDVPLYQRLVVIFRVNNKMRSSEFDPQRVYLRMFKNVPSQDIDMMLPATGIQMSWLDHSKIVVPSLYAFAITFWRFLRNVMLLALFGVFKTLALVLFGICAIGFGLKSMLTYHSATRQRYMLSMTQSLYYQNLDNNLGVLLRLLEEGEQQEAGEAMLAYFVMAFLLPNQPTDLETVDQQCESVLRSVCGIEIDFDIERTARTLLEFGMVRLDERGWSALDLEAALLALNASWDSRFSRA